MKCCCRNTPSESLTYSRRFRLNPPRGHFRGLPWGAWTDRLFPVGRALASHYRVATYLRVHMDGQLTGRGSPPRGRGGLLLPAHKHTAHTDTAGGAYGLGRSARLRQPRTQMKSNTSPGAPLLVPSPSLSLSPRSIVGSVGVVQRRLRPGPPYRHTRHASGGAYTGSLNRAPRRADSRSPRASESRPGARAPPPPSLPLAPAPARMNKRALGASLRAERDFLGAAVDAFFSDASLRRRKGGRLPGDTYASS